MIMWLRLGAVAILLGLLTIPFAAWQFVAYRSGWFDITTAPQLWYRVAVRLFRFRVRKTGDPETARPLLIVANHASWTDVLVLGSLVRGSFVAKSEVADWPVVGPLSKLQGTVLVDRARKEKTGRQVGEVAAGLQAGRAMILFAEGTTSDGTMLLPFKTPLFAAAREALSETTPTVFIQPVSIVYTRMGGLVMDRRQRAAVAWTGDEGLWPHLKRLLSANPVDVEVRFGPALPFAAGSDRKTIAREAEALVRTQMTSSLSGRG